jgi:hypothetical protein
MALDVSVETRAARAARINAEADERVAAECGQKCRGCGAYLTGDTYAAPSACANCLYALDWPKDAGGAVYHTFGLCALCTRPAVLNDHQACAVCVTGWQTAKTPPPENK